MSPSQTGRHQDIERRLASAIERGLPSGVRVRQAWSWKPSSDEFIPDLMVFDETNEDVRYTGTPLLVVEILSGDRAADLLRKAHKCALAGVTRYWVVDPDGPEIVEHVLDPEATTYVEVARHVGDDEVTIDIGVAEVTFVPARLAD